MREIMNERRMEKKSRATDLDVLRELKKRKALNKDYCQLLQKLEAKEAGIQTVLERVKKYANDHWIYVLDLALDSTNTLNCDFSLLTLAGVYTFEINHEPGFFELVEDEGFMNLTKMSTHPIQKTRKLVSQLQSLAKMTSVPLNVQGAAIFSNPNTEIMIRDSVRDIDIVTADQLDVYIQKIKREEKRYEGEPMITPMHLSWLGRIDRHHPLVYMHIPDHIKENIRKGILCCHCDSFDVEIGDPYISCACGMHESLEEATVRTICEYGVLNNDKDLEISALLDFFDYQISEDTLYAHLEKHFSPIY